MVFAVQCPSCRKFMLVEDHQRNHVVSCLLCKKGIRISGGPPPVPGPTKPSVRGTPPKS